MARIINKETLELINEINENLPFYEVGNKITTRELANDREIGIGITIPEYKNTDAYCVDLIINFTEEELCYKELVKVLNSEASKILKEFRDNILFEIVYGKVEKLIKYSEFDASMIDDTIKITIKL